MPRISVPANMSKLAPLNDFLQASLEGYPADLLQNVELVMEELFVNIYNYAYGEVQGEAEISFNLSFLDDKEYLCFSITDWGIAFNPFLNAPTPDLESDVENRPMGGLGVHFVRSLTAHYVYTRAYSANTLQLFFAIHDEKE